MNNTEFQRLADATLARLSDLLEAADESGALDVELGEGMLTIGLPKGKTIIVSKHGPSGQIWVSSPISGGLHFSQHFEKGWALADGTTLDALLAREVRELSGVDMAGA